MTICDFSPDYVLLPAYMKSYYNKMQAGQSVGSWGDFAQELKYIYKQQDDKERVKKKLIVL